MIRPTGSSGNRAATPEPRTPVRAATLVFLKYPEPGRVKTRLGAALGQEVACALYRAFVEALVAELRRGGLDPVLCYDPSEPERSFRSWLGAGAYRPQEGGDLGQRMEAALGQALEEGADRAVLIGTDSPHLDAGWIRRAHRCLDRAPAALGPCRDGGYYLVGVRAAVPDLFRGVEWSTGGVLGATLRRAEELGLAVEMLEESFDVDDLADLRLLLARLGSHPHLEALRPALVRACAGSSPFWS